MTGQELVDRVELDGRFQSGYLRFTQPQWHHRTYVRIYVMASSGSERRAFGPWGHLFDRLQQQALGEPTPQEFPLLASVNMKKFLAEEAHLYTGPLDISDTPTPDA